jgi:hypothetical protein
MFHVKLISKHCALAILLALATESGAHAVWAYRPYCEEASDESNERKNEIDTCIAKIDGQLQGQDKLAAQEEAKLPCASELKRLETAQANLRKCMRRQMWGK